MSVAIEIRVRPNSSKNRVGGVAGEPPRLIVAVAAPAVEGKANAAVLKLLASAFECRVRDCTIVFGELHRDKRVLISGDDVFIASRAKELMGILD